MELKDLFCLLLRAKIIYLIYKINGSSVSQSAYNSGFGAATTRSLEITVAIGAPTLYYYCAVHSGMGNQINT